MKRKTQESNADGSRKRVKTTSPQSHSSGAELFDFPEHQRYIASILHDQDVDGKPGYIAGKVFMKYPESEQNIHFIITTDDSEIGNKRLRVEVIFGKKCSKLLRRRDINFPLSSVILLSLRGCSADSGNSSHGVTGKLKFADKVLLKILSPGLDDVVVDLWDSNPLIPSRSADSDWFSTPRERPVEGSAVAAETKKISKRERRLLRAKGHLEKVNDTNKLDSDVVSIKAPKDLATASELVTPNHVPLDPVTAQETKAPLDKVDGPLGLKAGCRSEKALYTPLSNATRASIFYNVVGVVFSDSLISQTSSGDYMCGLHLVDPGSRSPSDNTHFVGTPTKVNCFAINSKWLPSVREGDIVILHNVKASNFNWGTNLVGYKDKLQWAIYGRDGKLAHGVIPSDIPRDTTTDRGFRFTPFLQSGDSTLLSYCSKLREWWNAVECKKKEFLGKTHQVGNHVLTPPPERSARPWLSIKDANTGTISNGYFNCVAEIIHKHRPDQQYYEIYVTDYTSNDQCPTYDNADWCPPGLAKSCLRVELWDRSTPLGPDMEIGDFYSFRNLRMKMANNGYYEAKIQEPKISKLDPDEVGSTHTILKSLLERRAKWATKHKIVERLEKSEYTKIEDVEMRARFNCIVEILHVDLPDGPGSAKVYATDYTANDLLPEPDFDANDFDGLHKRVFKFVLRDSQAEKAKALERGNVCVFQKVMMKLLNNENVGDLGGEQRLISRLNPGLDSHKALMKDLENRKKIFFGTPDDAKESPGRSRSLSTSASTSEPRFPESPGRTSPLPSSPKICTSIKQLRSRVGTTVLFGIPARVKWAKPRELWDYCRPYCRKCEKRIPPNQKACVACDDFDHEFVIYQYSFNLSIEDKEGNEMPVTVLDEALFLNDLPRVNLNQDSAALGKFRACFEALAGNVLEYQNERCAGIDDTKLKTPLVCLYGARYEEEGKQICQLLSYTLLES
ncbi:hypothetical protein C8R41DRAFT_906893 [Lentinula lateritia]|uniref:Telomeric single stranded DNA binding POT1/Cdc13 domain-containing protein n=1 Tax=Lentinula lateritia TaxID=40482 RepID=A0ABQ8UZR7_9AGAR|nr:hypothetical protein C8R41DRAFT_906893 [Lentinula lateritia]